MRKTLLICVLGLAAAGCLGDGGVVPIKEPGDTEPRDPPPGRIAVFEYGPHLRQCEGPQLTLKESAGKLVNAGIAVSRSSCGYTGMMYPTVCGAGTGEIMVHDIPEASEAEAAALGFARVDEQFGDWSRAPCPSFMHALEEARNPHACADLRNRVLVLQNQRNPHEQLTLLDQAGTCHDASYRHILYGGNGEDVVCSLWESIAGPQKSCAVERYAAMFDTLIANLDRSDLGLGRAWDVKQVYPAG
jgi:hypothetical protein